MSDRRKAAAISALVFAAVAPVTYQIQRLLEIARVGTTDASLIIGTTHTAYFWRCAVAAWFAATCAAYAYLARRGALARPGAAALLARVALVLSALVTIAAVRFP